MKKLLEILDKIERIVIRGEEAVMFIVSIVLIAVVFIQVICRYVLYISTPWAEELAIFTFIWIAWIGAAYAVYSRDHLQINIMDALVKRLKNPGLGAKLVDCISILLTLLFLLIFFVGYMQFFNHVAARPQYSTAAHWPLLIIQAAPVIGVSLMIFHAVIRCLKVCRTEKGGEA